MKRYIKCDVEEEYTIMYDNGRREHDVTGTLDYLLKYFSYTLKKGYSWQHEPGNHRINKHPETIEDLVDNLNWSAENSSANGYPDTTYWEI